MPARQPHHREKPGRPRSADTDEALLLATYDLVGSGQAVTVEAVARRAGVGKPSIYRRWPHDPVRGLVDLALADAQRSLLPARASQPQDAAELCGVVAAQLTDPLRRALLRLVLADPARLSKHLQPITDALRSRLIDGEASDHLCAQLLAAVVGSALVGPTPAAAHEYARCLAEGLLAQKVA